MIENWKLWKYRSSRKIDTRLIRYGTALVLIFLAMIVTNLRPALFESPYLLYFSAIILTAVCSGLGPSFLAIGLAALLIRFLYISPRFSLYFGSNFEDMERMAVFVFVSLIVSSLVAGLRKERNELRETEERYRILAETASDAIIVVSERGDIVFVNPVAERMFGQTSDHLVGHNLNTILPEEKYSAHLAQMRSRLDTRKEPVAVQLPVLRSGSEHLLVEMTLGAFTKHGQNLFTAIIRDITGRKRNSNSRKT